MPAPDTRLAHLLAWLGDDLGHTVAGIEPASQDASFRRYFRARIGADSYIAMDAPPPRENVRPFLKVAELLRGAGVRTPVVHAADPERGFVLLGDFGSQCYLDRLDVASADALYADALASLARLQTGVDPARAGLPAYDEKLLRTELGIFREWFLDRLLHLEPDAAETAALDRAGDALVASALEQPQVCVHRDYHSRNLMVVETANPGVLDFQDAVIGPITYDLVSLLRDCYIAWPTARVEVWMEGYRETLCGLGLLQRNDPARFRRWFDLMGMQRHLKAAGIFARLWLRDGRPGYLKDIPRTLGYVVEAGAAYPEFRDFLAFLNGRALPRFAAEVRP